MEFQEQKIETCFQFIRNGISIKQEDGKSGIPITRIETIWNSNIDLTRLGYADVFDVGKIKNYFLQSGDILMSHINSPKHLGKNAIYLGNPKTLIHGMNLLCLRPKENLLLPKYAFYFFSSDYFKIQLPTISNQSVNQASFSAGNLKDLLISIPSLATQQCIVNILDAADALRKKTQQLIDSYDELAQSIFLDMFGDPVRNEKGWKFDSLKNHGLFKNGLNFSMNEFGNDFHYLGVGEFKDLSKLTDINSLPKIFLSKIPAKDYFLKNNDLVFVRSNGSKALVGRCLLVQLKNEKVVFSGFCIRYRLSSNLMNPVFLLKLFKNTNFKIAMLQNGRGANIQNINQKLLSDLMIPIPSIKIQNLFAEKIELIEQQKELAKQSLKESEDLFNTLLQKAFKGELAMKEN